jgi:hypothetical protein
MDAVPQHPIGGQGGLRLPERMGVEEPVIPAGVGEPEAGQQRGGENQKRAEGIMGTVRRRKGLTHGTIEEWFLPPTVAVETTVLKPEFGDGDAGMRYFQDDNRCGRILQRIPGFGDSRANPAGRPAYGVGRIG